MDGIDIKGIIFAVKALAKASQAEVSTAVAAPAAPVTPEVSAPTAAEVQLRSILGRAKKE